MSPKQMLIAIIIAALLGVTGASTFIVDQRQQALVLQLGEPLRVVTDAGLHFKLPWPVNNVVTFDRRLLEDDAAANEVITKDKKTILVDNYTRWRISDPLKVFQVARNQREVAARMEDVVRGKVREVLGQHTLQEIVSGGEEANLRAQLMQMIRDRADKDVRDLGIQVVDVRIKRADLPSENSDAVFERMKAERQRIAKEYRSEGEEAAKEIRAEAEKQRQVMLADAYRQSEIIRGQAEAEATAIYAKAHERDPKFYAFMRSLEAYRNSIQPGTRLVISPDSEFFQYFERSTGTGK
ncbi:MAG TPA: protease modulator HflC [Mariprofundaceae bacterium]|nr:protease modulator HflC [Mariprofundaceae bacterium]